MPRRHRIDAPGMRHHVMIRGVRRGLIFVDDLDRHRFLTIFERVLLDAGMPCDAWALIPNHAHAALATPPSGSLSRTMHRLLTSYAVYFNRRHEGSGYVFQGRFLSKPVTEEGGWLRVIRYVHLNPYDAGIVSSIEELGTYPWAGHAVLMGNRSFPPQRSAFVLEQFGRDLGRSRRRLCEWMGMGLDERGKLLSLSDEGGAAVADVPFGASEWRWVPRPTWGGLEEMVSLATGVPRAVLLGHARRREIVCARSLLVFLALHALGLRSAEVARRLGLTPGAVTHAGRRGRAIARELLRPHSHPHASAVTMARRLVEQWLEACELPGGPTSPTLLEASAL